MFNFLDDQIEITGLDVCGESTLFIFKVAHWIIRIIQIAVPFALIIWGSLDFFKAVIAGDEKEMKAKRKPFIQRLIAAVFILILPTIVNIILATFAKNTEANKDTFATCWTKSSDYDDIIIGKDKGNKNNNDATQDPNQNQSQN